MHRYQIIPYVLSLLLLASCSSKSENSSSSQLINVTDYVVKAKNIPAVFDFIGFAESSHPVEIRARVEGYLDTLAYEEGQQVKAGQLLYQLDPSQYKAKVEQAAAEVAREAATLENAILTVNRLAPLYKQKAASKKDLDNAISTKLASQASLEAAQANLLYAQINLDYTTIYSPITGLAAKSRFHEGALINPGTSSELTTIYVMDPIWVYFTISDTDLLNVQEEEAKKRITLPEDNKGVLPQKNDYVVEAIMSDGSVYPHKGTVNYSSPTYDQATGSLLARAVFPNPENKLRPGEFFHVKVYGAMRPNALLVPRRALLQKNNGMFVYLIDKDNKVIAQDISTGDWYGDYQIVTNGLKENDHIVVDGINKIRAGSFVHVTGAWAAPLSTDTLSSPQKAL